MLYFYLALDSLNGYLLREFAISITPPYRILLITLMLFELTKRKIYQPIFVFVLFLLINLIHLITSINLEGLSNDITWSLKYIIIINTYYFFRLLINQKYNVFIIIKNVFGISFAILIVNLLLGVLGFGYTTYLRDNLGTVGFFYAGNEVALLMLTIFFFWISYSYIQKKTIWLYLLYTGIVFSGIFISTRTALIGSLTLMLFLSLINAVNTKYKIRAVLYVLNLVIVAILLGGTIFTFAMNNMNLEARYHKYFEKHNDKVISEIYGGREDWGKAVVSYIDSKDEINAYFFGFGYSIMLVVIGKTVENDFIDLYFMFGSLGIILTYGFLLLKMLTYTRNYLKFNLEFPFSLYSSFYIIFLLIISVTSGHALMSSLSGVLIGIILSLPYIHKSVIIK